MIAPVGNISSGININAYDRSKTKSADDKTQELSVVPAETAANKTDSNVATDAALQSKTSDNGANNKKEPDYTELSAKISKALGDSNLSIEYSLDKDSKQMVMKVVNNETKETVRQFPSEISIKLAKIAASVLDVGHLTNAKI